MNTEFQNQFFSMGMKDIFNIKGKRPKAERLAA